MTDKPPFRSVVAADHRLLFGTAGYACTCGWTPNHASMERVETQHSDHQWDVSRARRSVDSAQEVS